MSYVGWIVCFVIVMTLVVCFTPVFMYDPLKGEDSDVVF